MFIDICYHCDGTGERNFLSGARCYECNGTGIREEEEFDDYRDDEFEEEDIDESQQ